MSMRIVALAALLALASLPGRAETGPTSLFTVEPCRLLDTRVSPGAPVTGGTAIDVLGRDVCNVPQYATALFLTVTAVTPTGPGYLKVYGTADAPPTAALTYGTGETAITSGVLVELATNELWDFKVYSLSTAHVVVDVTGYAAYATTEIASGHVLDIQGSCPSTGSCFSTFYLDSGLSVACSPHYVDIFACSGYGLGDCIEVAGFLKLLFGQPTLYAQAIRACPEPPQP